MRTRCFPNTKWRVQPFLQACFPSKLLAPFLAARSWPAATARLPPVHRSPLHLLSPCRACTLTVLAFPARLKACTPLRMSWELFRWTCTALCLTIRVYPWWALAISVKRKAVVKRSRGATIKTTKTTSESIRGWGTQVCENWMFLKDRGVRLYVWGGGRQVKGSDRIISKSVIFLRSLLWLISRHNSRHPST